MSDKDVELNSVTKQNGVIEIVYKNETDFDSQIGFFKYPGSIGVVKSRKKLVRVFAHDGVLHKFEKSV
jgi:hypothetical protein